ncbi:MarR family transcriptional regulator [Cellulophaga lytica]|uniref:MarR family winged helix-turn-helix transcriptional regulator n=1 Tax=Cellulophaga lytica TaxID=979 RepID=UPI000B5C9FB4|nr:MarR family transcriptional regulator [Cellulophaga lytica]MDO6854655.1 MarR family transcriptional regulator [Cellulophaga lytica]SNQ44012.1 MarR-type transcriptional regulator [Cellulophaga lytica]
MDVEKILKTNKPIPLEGRTIIHLLLIHQSITEKTAEALKPFDVSAQQFNVLRILKGQNGKPANLSTLNDRMVSKMSNTTRLVDKLILKDFVKRTVCKENRRKIEIYITKKGEEELIKMSSAMLGMEKNLLKNTTEEDLKTLNKLLDKFNTDN